MQALYRKYRPRTFDEILGQKSITQTLKNQIKSGDVGHAYLFLGTRGTGKTSAAKIMARAVNCESLQDGNPCNECSSCRGILEERILDIIEMDAASNNSVDDIRELKDKAAYPPAFTKKKVYIIDEVHMLSKGAFNALLKVLEEPPKHILFILATTEPQKIPPTIISRTQRFHFNRIQEDNIVKELGKVLDREGKLYDEGAISLIANHSDGSMRDALSILDQSINSNEERLQEDQVKSILGLTDNEVFERIIDAIISNDPSLILDQVNLVYRRGGNLPRFLESLMAYFRDFLILKTTSNFPSHLSKNEKDIMLQQLKSLDTEKIFYCLDTLNQSLSSLKYAQDIRLVCEVCLLKLLQEPNLQIQEKKEIRATAENFKSQKVPKTLNKNIAPSNQESEKNEIVQGELPPLNNSTSNDIIKKEVSSNQENLELKWEKLKNTIRGKRPSTYALLKEANLYSYENNQLIISFNNGFEFHKLAIENDLNKAIVVEAAQAILGPVDDFKTFVIEDKNDTLQKLIETFGEDKVEVIDD